MGQKWIELTVFTTDQGIEPVCAVLTAAGITGLSGTQNAVWYKVSLEESNEIRKFVENSKTMSWNQYVFYRFPAKFNSEL